MSPNTLPVAALAAACVTAAAAGGYFAVRDNAVVVTPQAAVLEATPQTGTSLPAPAAAALPPAENVAEAPAARQAAPVAPVRRSATVTRARTEAPARASAPSSSSAPVESPAAPAATVAESTAQASDPAAPAHAPVVFSPPTWHSPSPAPVAREIVVAADSVIGLRLDSTVSSEHAAVEDRVEARVVRDVTVDAERAIPEGSRLIGSVMVVERGGKFKERARLGIRFHTLVLGDGTELPVTTETIYRYGDAVGNKSAAKIGGGAVAGAILGAIVGGSKGAAVGATSGAGAGTAVVMAGDRSEAVFAAGTQLTARILAPVAVTLED